MTAVKQGTLYFPVLSGKQVELVETILAAAAVSPGYGSATMQRRIGGVQESLERAKARPGVRP